MLRMKGGTDACAENHARFHCLPVRSAGARGSAKPAHRCAGGSRLLAGAARSHHAVAARRHRQGHDPGRRADDRAPRQGRVFRVHGRARSGDQGADDQGCDLPHLLDDQADHLGRRHDAVRAGQDHARRSDRQVHSGVQGHEGRRRDQGRGRQAEARARRGEAADHHPGPAAPHLGPYLRLLRRHAGEEGLCRRQRARRRSRPMRSSSSASPGCRSRSSPAPPGTTAIRPTFSAGWSRSCPASRSTSSRRRTSSIRSA